jgi:hypothetical protein
MATKKRKRFNEGGITEAEDKARGLKSSKDDKVSFFERLRMGNIDDEGSEAYRRFGAGRAKADRDMESEAAAMRAVDESRASAAASPAKEPAKKSAEESVIDSLLAAGAAEGMRKDSGDASVAEMYSGPRTKPIERVSPAKTKPAPKMQEQTYRRTSGNAVGRPETSRAVAKSLVDQIPRDKGPSSLMDQIPRDKSTVVGGKKIDSTELGRDAMNLLNAAGPGRLAGAVRLAAEVQGAKRVQDAYNKAATARRTAEMRAKGDATKFASQPKATQKNAAKKTKKFDDSESNIEFKRGGSVSGASKRADGIAIKGKTRCKMR